MGAAGLEADTNTTESQGRVRKGGHASQIQHSHVCQCHQAADPTCQVWHGSVDRAGGLIVGQRNGLKVMLHLDMEKI
jgi:hypothetical protein